MILGVFCMVLANAATLLGAHALLDRVRSGKPSSDFVLFLLLRLVLLSATVIAAGLCRMLTPTALGAAGLIACLALVGAGSLRRLPRGFRMPWNNVWALLAALLALRLLLQVWFFAPYTGDSLAYPLPKIAEWIRGNGFTGEVGVDRRSTFPAGFELIEAWWVVFLHHDVLIEMAGVEFLMLGAAAVYAIAEGLGWGGRTGAIAALLFALNPAIHFQATSSMNDGAVAALVLAAASLIVSGASPLLVLLPLALGAGIKPTFVYAVPGLALLAALVPRGEDPGRTSTLPVLALDVAAVLVGSSWYLRNWVVYGNPIYPMGPGGMKSLVTGATVQRLGPSLRALRENLTCLLDIRIYDQLRPPDALCTSTWSWGPAGFALGAVALVPVLREDRLFRRLAVSLGVSALCIFTLVELDSWYLRFAVFLAALPALALARIWDRYRFVPVLGAIAILVQFAETAVPGNLSPEAFRAMVRQSWRERSAVPAPPEARTGVVAFACDDYGGAYPLYLPSYERGVVYLRDQTTDELLAHLDRDGVTLIYVTGGMPLRGGIFEEAVRRGRLRPVAHGEWTGYAVLPRG